MKPIVSFSMLFGHPWAFRSPVAATAGAACGGAGAAAGAGGAAGLAAGASVGLAGRAVGLTGAGCEQAASRPLPTRPSPTVRSCRRLIRLIGVSIIHPFLLCLTR